MAECNCSLRARLVGDGCEVCNPALALEYAKERIADADKLLRDLVEAIDRCAVAGHTAESYYRLRESAAYFEATEYIGRARMETGRDEDRAKWLTENNDSLDKSFGR